MVQNTGLLWVQMHSNAAADQQQQQQQSQNDDYSNYQGSFYGDDYNGYGDMQQQQQQQQSQQSQPAQQQQQPFLPPTSPNAFQTPHYFFEYRQPQNNTQFSYDYEDYEDAEVAGEGDADVELYVENADIEMETAANMAKAEKIDREFQDLVSQHRFQIQRLQESMKLKVDKTHKNFGIWEHLDVYKRVDVIATVIADYAISNASWLGILASLLILAAGVISCVLSFQQSSEAIRSTMIGFFSTSVIPNDQQIPLTLQCLAITGCIVSVDPVPACLQNLQNITLDNGATWSYNPCIMTAPPLGKITVTFNSYYPTGVAISAAGGGYQLPASHHILLSPRIRHVYNFFPWVKEQSAEWVPSLLYDLDDRGVTVLYPNAVYVVQVARIDMTSASRVIAIIVQTGGVVLAAWFVFTPIARIKSIFWNLTAKPKPVAKSVEKTSNGVQNSSMATKVTRIQLQQSPQSPSTAQSTPRNDDNASVTSQNSKLSVRFSNIVQISTKSSVNPPSSIASSPSQPSIKSASMRKAEELLNRLKLENVLPEPLFDINKCKDGRFKYAGVLASTCRWHFSRGDIESAETIAHKLIMLHSLGRTMYDPYHLLDARMLHASILEHKKMGDRALEIFSLGAEEARSNISQDHPAFVRYLDQMNKCIQRIQNE